MPSCPPPIIATVGNESETTTVNLKIRERGRILQPDNDLHNGEPASGRFLQIKIKAPCGDRGLLGSVLLRMGLRDKDLGDY